MDRKTAKIIKKVQKENRLHPAPTASRMVYSEDYDHEWAEAARKNNERIMQRFAKTNVIGKGAII